MANKKPIKIVTLDTETYNGLIGDLKRIAVYDGIKVYYGYTFEDIENVLINYDNAGYDVHCYIHNAEFDLRKIPSIFDDNNVIWSNSFMIKNRLATLSCQHYTIHDSFRILPMSLADLSDGFNVEHGKLSLFKAIEETYPNQYTIYDDNGKVLENATIVNFLDKCPVDDPLFLEYLGYDVISLYEVLQKFMSLTGIPEHDFVKRISTASVSRYLFKNGYKGEMIKLPFNTMTDYEMLCSYKWWHKEQEIEEFIRSSYCGGRTEVFKPILNNKGFHYDVNSLYPYVMSKCGEYPIGKPRYMKKKHLAKKTYETWLKDKQGLGFLYCKVFIPEQPIPPLPVKMGKLTFPTGYVWGVWTYEELEYACTECGCEILEYMECVHFDNTYPVFERFVDMFYKLKEEGTRTKNKALRTLAKLILNVGYGYTGMRRDDKTSLRPYEEYLEHDKIIFADKDLGYIEVPTEVKAQYIQVQVASYVTSRARLVLLKALREVIKRGGNVYYCDTDSIVCDIPLPAELIDKEKLGFWDLENEPDKAIFLMPKVYSEVMGEDINIKFKGIGKDTQQELDFSDYEYLLKEIERGQKDYEVIEKNKLQLRSIMYMQKNKLDPNYYELRDKKMNFKTVQKRLINYTLNETKAHHFNSFEEFEGFSYKTLKKQVPFDMKGVNI